MTFKFFRKSRREENIEKMLGVLFNQLSYIRYDIETLIHISRGDAPDRINLLSDEERRERAQKIREKYAHLDDEHLPDGVRMQLEILENVKAHIAYELVPDERKIMNKT